MPTPKSKRTVVLQSGNHDSESGSLRDAIAAAGDESTESESQDTLIAVDSEVRPIFTNTPLPFPASNPSPSLAVDSEVRPIFTNTPLPFPASNPSPSLTDTIDSGLFSSQPAESDEVSSLASVPLTIGGQTSLVTDTFLPYNVYTLTSESSPVVDRTIGLANTSDSGSGSLRDAVADSTKVTLKNLIIANATGGSQDESTEFNGSNGVLTVGNYITFSGSGEESDGNINSGDGNDVVSEVGNDILIGGYSEPSRETGKKLKQLRPLGVAFTETIDDELSFDQFNGFPGLSGISGNNTSRVIPTGEGYSDGNDSSGSGDGADTLLGGYSEPSRETGKKLKQLRPLGVAFTDSLNDELSFDEFNGFPGLSAIQRSQEAVSEFSGVGLGETTLLLPAVQSAREHAHFSGASSSDGAWALGSTFELTSREPFSSQVAVSGGGDL